MKKTNPIRIISRLDVKGPNLVKGIQLEGLRKIGDPNIFAQNYYNDGIDEILYMDIVASLYNRNNLSEIVKQTTQDVFVPVTVGGGLRTIEDVRQALNSGADKIAINTATVKRPELISEIAESFGCQCIVLSIEAKQTSPGKWEVYYDNGREKTGINAIEWAQQGCEFGAGEILITSIDREGTQTGFDCELVKRISSSVSVPVIASGGMGSIQDLIDVINYGQADAVAIGSCLHYGKTTVKEIKRQLFKSGINVRIEN